jgi:hypothetical protein
MGKTNYLIFGLLFCTSPLFSQSNKHLIYFTDKAGTPFSVDQPGAFLSQKALARRAKNNVTIDQRDLPVTPNYVQQVNATGARVLHTTKWLNGAIIEASFEQLNTVLGLPFVQRSQILKRPGVSNPNSKFEVADRHIQKSIETEFNYGTSASQIRMLGIDRMHEDNISGKNVTLAVFDAGFPGVDTHEAFDYHFSRNRFKGGYNLVAGSRAVFQDNRHGTQVLSNIIAYLPEKLMGGAYDADFYLFTTEDVASEYEIECANWVVAAEKADSLGVDVINSSLGYWDFDNPSQNYTFNMLDGNTTIISKAARIAGAKGMIVVSSAGNYGGSFGHIVAPADADSILTVGAVTSGRTYAGFSSRGPTADGRVKPDVSAMGSANTLVDYTTRSEVIYGSGTSYAAPMIAGLVAGLIEKFPNTSYADLMQAIRMSGDSSNTPNGRIGYGIPNYQRVVQLVASIREHLKLQTFEVYPNPAAGVINLAIPISELGQSTFKVLNQTGKEVASGMVQSVDYQAKVDVSALKPGLYHLQIKTAKGNWLAARFAKN